MCKNDNTHAGNTFNGSVKATQMSNECVIFAVLDKKQINKAQDVRQKTRFLNK